MKALMNYVNNLLLYYFIAKIKQHHVDCFENRHPIILRKLMIIYNPLNDDFNN